MKYLEEIYKMYKEQKKNPLPEIEDLPEIEAEKIDNLFEKIKEKEKTETTQKITPEYEFGEIYYFISNVPIFFMINGEIEESDGNLYSVYKVSDFIDFATQDDFIFEIDEFPYMVETWNEFYLPKDILEKAVFVGKIDKKDLEILEKVLDENIEIPQDKRGLTILEEGNYIQNLFKEDEVEDVQEFKTLIFQVFDQIEKKEQIQILEEMLYKSLEEQEIELPELAYAAEEEKFAERKDFMMIKEGDELFVKVTNKDLIGKEGKIRIFGKTIEGKIPENFKIKIPPNLKKVSIEYIADNLKIEV